MNFFEKIKNIILPKYNDSHEFEPILAEIEDSPVNPIGNTIFWIIIIFIIVALLWLYLGKVDIVITARGLVIPNGEEKYIQTLDKGVLNKLLVKEGDYISKGQIVAIVTPAEYEPMLELNNLKEEEIRILEQIAINKTKYNIAKNNLKRLDTVKDIIPISQYNETLNEINETGHTISALNASLLGIKNRHIQIEKQKQILKSPIDGYINEIYTHTEGGVVSPAEKIVSIVPKNAQMQIKAKVLNQDIGFIETNMPVSIKVDTFNFQKYGILNGIVTVISPNSIKDEQLGEIYEVYIKPTNKTLMVEGKEQSIKFGMTTTNEIKIGKRRIIEFFIYPLIKYLDESIKVK